ncbi:undecaprenyl-diphosphate phosphatase [Thiothrix nivea]|uniref:Undecaprenyl-diphosphatase n=1 Tax=Thiothrix nivea (strain ATCC 35100 / DSM 5205 / JP2) TaxID=870187 RepID=A0A656HFV4_THINJ|nr:undecaprenyl-diphosphate phosphatase [Thiothrix nivea]EIJ34280.1 Undecaprenyl-diphosphatase [Thiothrix nivea DSM 5205]
MDIIHAIILGIVEGITEFLPISSTGHMIVVADWLGIPRESQNTAFEIIIQFAAIFAVIANYTDKFHPRHLKLWVKVLIAFLPIAVIGFLFADLIESLFDVKIVAWMFIIGGVIFLLLEHFYRDSPHRVHDMENMSFQQAAWVGFAQIFALVPGTSRAGATIVGGMLAGLDRKASAEFSFLLALPVLGASSAYSLLKHYDEFASTSFAPLIVGFVVSFVVAYLTMKIFLGFLEKFTFRTFGIYRILFGLLLLWWLA